MYEGLGPQASLKKSIEVIKKTWGENLIKAIGLGLVQFLVMVLFVVVAGGLTYFLSAYTQDLEP